MTGFSGTVERVHEDHGSRIEPPLDHDWHPIDRVRWKAAVVMMDSGLDIRVSPGRVKLNGVPLRGSYEVRVRGALPGYTSVLNLSYESAWTYLQGIEIGAKARKSWRESW